jgi:enoyl-CoA hydratase/carnithine racemase
MDGQLQVERADGGVAVLTLNRPEKRNALSIELRFELARRLATLGAGDATGALVVTGAGSAFCSGMDVTEFGGDLENRRRIVESSIAAFGAMGGFSKPAVAAVNGPAIAGGFALALLCDIRIASSAARFGFGELPRGVPPSYASARAALPAAVARELSLTGRVVDAGEALTLGIVSEIVEPERLVARAREVAAAAAGPAGAVTKQRILLERRHRFGRLFLDEEWALRQALLGGPAATPP